MTNKTFHPLFSRSLIAGAVLAMTAGFAQAQSSVTLYGRLDAGVTYTSDPSQNLETSTVSNDSKVEVSNGNYRPSIWGMKGSEDLGSGMSAFFNLESHIRADTGRFDNAGQLFRRQANVGIKSSMGTVTLGRQFSPAVIPEFSTDPRAMKEDMSGLYAFALMQAQNSDGVNGNDLGIFVSNAVSYSNTFGPVSFGALISAGEAQTGKTYALGGTLNAGFATFSGSFQRVEDVANDNDGTDYYSVGAAVPLGSFALKGIYRESKTEVAGIEVIKLQNYAVGVDFKWNPSNLLTVSYYSTKDDAALLEDETNSIIVSNDYSLSKRTTLYAQAAFVDPSDNASVLTSHHWIERSPVAREKTTIFTVGISHNF